MYRSGEKEVIAKDLPEQMKAGAERVVASADFSPEDMAELHPQFLSTYWAPEIRGYELAAMNGDGLEYKDPNHRIEEREPLVRDSPLP